MATADSVKHKLRGLIDGANQTTGADDATLTDAVTRLRNGFGTGAVTEPLSITENGTYTPDEGVDGFSRVDVNVSTTLPPMSNPASAEDVIDGKEYIGSDGVIHTGNIPIRSSDDVSFDAHKGVHTVSMSVSQGYYPQSFSLSGVAGGDANIVTQEVLFSVDSNISNNFVTHINDAFGMPKNLAACLHVWSLVFKDLIGKQLAYMPASVMLPNTAYLQIINGAFVAFNDVDLSGTTEVRYFGTESTGTKKLSVGIESSQAGDKVKTISMYNGDNPVDLPNGLPAYLYFTMPLLD